VEKGKCGGVEVEFALLGEVENGDGGEGFAGGGDSEEVVGLDREAGVPVGVAEAAGVEEAAVLGDGERGTGELVLLEEGGHEVVEGGEVGDFRAGDGEGFGGDGGGEEKRKEKGDEAAHEGLRVVEGTWQRR
jgi:hypothetical protein